MGEPAGDQHGHGQVGEHHAGPVVRCRPVVGVVLHPGAGRRPECEVQGQLAAGEDARERGGRPWPGPGESRREDDEAGHRRGGRGGRDRASGTVVRRDAEDGGDETEQHGARGRGSVGGHGDPR